MSGKYINRNACSETVFRVSAPTGGQRTVRERLNLFQTLVGAIVLSRTIRKLVPEETKYVGVMLPNMVVNAVSLLAVMIADKVPSPLNFTVSDETLRYSIRKAGMTHILTSRKFLAKLNRQPLPEMVFLEDLATEIPKTAKLWWAFLAAVLPHQELMNLVSPVSHRDLSGTAVLLFSSGSTGEPKGVMLSHRNINGDLYSFIRVMGWTNRDKLLGNLPLFHSFGFTTGFWMPLVIACKVVYIVWPRIEKASAFDPACDSDVHAVLSPPLYAGTVRFRPAGDCRSGKAAFGSCGQVRGNDEWTDQARGRIRLYGAFSDRIN